MSAPATQAWISSKKTPRASSPKGNLSASTRMREKICDKGWHPLSRPQRPPQNAALIVLGGSKNSWSLADRNRFSRLHYPRYSETFFRYVTTVVKLASTATRCQKAIRKRNNIIIGRLTTGNRPHIVSDSWRFDTTADWHNHDVCSLAGMSFCRNPGTHGIPPDLAHTLCSCMVENERRNRHKNRRDSHQKDFFWQ